MIVVWLPFFFLAGTTKPVVTGVSISQSRGGIALKNIADSISPTPLPPEYLANRDQTIGILVGGMILIMIVIIGTLSTIRRKK